MNNIFTYDKEAASRSFLWVFELLYGWLTRRKWNKYIPTVEEDVPDAHYILTVRKYTEELWTRVCYSRTIKIGNFRFILVSL